MVKLEKGGCLREAFWSELADVMAEDQRIIVLDGDLANSTRADIVAARFPERFLEMGVAEQNMLGVAAGMATMGWSPYVSSFACFAVSRGLDSTRVLIAQPGLGAKIIGGYSGLLLGTAGKTHQEVGDIAVMRAMPHMTVLAPADDVEVRGLVRALVTYEAPTYVRLPKKQGTRIFDFDHSFRIGEVAILREGDDLTIFSTGVQSTRALEAADELDGLGISAHVVHVPTLKPLDTDAIVAAACRTGKVVTSEEHSVVGGLGSAVTEALSAAAPMKVERLGIQDTFGESGSDDDLADKYGLSVRCITTRVARLMDDWSTPCCKT